MRIILHKFEKKSKYEKITSVIMFVRIHLWLQPR